MLVLADYSGVLVEKLKRRRGWGVYLGGLGIGQMTVITKNLVFINISGILCGRFLAQVREKIIFV